MLVYYGGSLSFSWSSRDGFRYTPEVFTLVEYEKIKKYFEDNSAEIETDLKESLLAKLNDGRSSIGGKSKSGLFGFIKKRVGLR